MSKNKNKIEEISTEDAMKLAMNEFGIKKSIFTIRLWANKYPWGRRLGGQYYIDVKKFRKFLRGE